MSERQVFAVGFTSGAGSRLVGRSSHESEPAPMREIGAAAIDLGVRLQPLADLASLRAALDDADPLAVFVPAGGGLMTEVCLALRSHARFARVPAFGVTGDAGGAATDLTFVELFQAGGDDLVPAIRHAVLKRLRPLLSHPTTTTLETPRREGTVIVAGSDHVWRSVLGRTLYNGGLSVRFVDDPELALAEADAEDVKFVVVADEEGASSVELVKRARKRGQAVPWIVVSPPRRIAQVADALRTFEKAAVTDAFAPPENVLFLANELSKRVGTDNRASARHLFGTRVSFRVAGREADEIGFTYNVSEGGLYVRTAAPVEPADEVWLEMWPPRCERRVRLAGKVAWRRHLGPNDFATVPAGFGVKLTDGLGGDLERWKAGYRAYAEQFAPARLKDSADTTF